MAKINFSNGDEVTVEDGVTARQILKEHKPSSLKKTVAVKLDGELKDLSAEVRGDHLLELVSVESGEGLEVYRHSTSHVMAHAVQSLYDGIQVTIGPSIENGFYYDFDSPVTFGPEDLEKIEEKMAEIIKSGLEFTRTEVSREEAVEKFKSIGEEYKLELLEDIPEGEPVSIYSIGGFSDLCRGPHLPNTSLIKAFKLTGTAGAYWRGDENNKMLQRVYGTAFPKKKGLEEHLALLEEAKRRDHRRLGKDLDLFSIMDDVGAGLVLWHPKGSVVRGEIENFWKKEHYRGGYDIIHTPHVAKADVWKTSGHWDFYRESLYSPMDVDGVDYLVKPMNCPFHINIYKSNLRSYRELPLRYAELGTVYRFERSGALHGLLRVRGFTQDDAHLFVRPDQLTDEIRGVINFTLYILKSFGFNDFDVYLSTRPDKYVGGDAEWEAAEAALKEGLEAEGLAYEIDPGEGVFYGPKIDIKIKDSIGRSWQCSTIQVDFNLPERFDVTYRDSDGNETRPIMIHRALMGSLERFFGCLIEHYAGAFPLWLAPLQAKVLTVTDRNSDYGREVCNTLRGEGIRAELDDRSEKLGFKIREAEMQKVPYMIIVGDKDEEAGTVSPRGRVEGNMDAMSAPDLLTYLQERNKPSAEGSSSESSAEVEADKAG